MLYEVITGKGGAHVDIHEGRHHGQVADEAESADAQHDTIEKQQCVSYNFV